MNTTVLRRTIERVDWQQLLADLTAEHAQHIISKRSGLDPASIVRLLQGHASRVQYENGKILVSMWRSLPGNSAGSSPPSRG